MPALRTFAFAVLPLLALAPAACLVTNGDAIPSEIYDASPLDVRGNIDPDRSPSDGRPDANDALPPDADTSDAPDAPPNNAPVHINEVFVDNAVLGDGAEFVELRAAPGTRADDLKLRLIRADGEVKYEVGVGAAGATFGSSGLWVVGGPQTFKLNVQERVDRSVSVAGWGLDNARGAVQLVRGSTLLDVVGYATDPDSGTMPLASSAPSSTGEGKPARVPTAAPTAGAPARSLGRKASGPDANDNFTDFCAMKATPGYAQSPCE